jgi:hypothetical protein
MAVRKARWFNNAEAAVVLNIDDLSYGFMDITNAGHRPFNDWGLGCRGPNGVFRYFEAHLLDKYPELKYTVFLPFGRHSIGMVETRYPARAGDIFESAEFGELLQHIVASGHEIAYHGHHHGRKAPTVDPRTWLEEDVELGPDGYRDLVTADLARIHDELGISVRGGRSPGYRNNPPLLATVGSGLFKWWSFDFTPFQCRHAYRQGLYALPTNVEGRAFGRSVAYGPRTGFRSLLQRPAVMCLRNALAEYSAEVGIRRLLRQHAVIAVAEHFMGTRPDGRRQIPNVFDDIDSLGKIFSLLRGADVWHATCTQIAHYRESYDFTALTTREDGTFEMVYNGSWDDACLTLTADAREIQNARTGEIMRGVYRRGQWVFNNFSPGSYRLPPRTAT